MPRKITRSSNDLAYNAPFPKRLRELIKDSSKTQQEIADKIEVTRQMISRYSSGDASPSFEKLCALADYFGVTIDYLLGRDECSLPEIQAIFEQIGLTQRSINKLKEMNELKIYPLENQKLCIINELIEQDYFISCLYNYIHGKEYDALPPGLSAIENKHGVFDAINLLLLENSIRYWKNQITRLEDKNNSPLDEIVSFKNSLDTLTSLIKNTKE